MIGIQPVREALRAHGAELDRVFVARDGGPTLDALARFAADQGVRVERVEVADLDSRCRGGRHQGALAIARALVLSPLESLELGPGALVAVLDGVTDPQNFGAVIRSAVALGTGEVVFAEHAAAPLTPATFRASAGAVEHARLVRVASLRSAVDVLAERGLTIVALDATAPTALADVDLTGPAAIVVGAEDRGVSRPVRQAATVTARLPMSGRVASLNASVALAIALYEAVRQRRPA